MSLRIESSVVTWLIVASAPALALSAAGCGEDFESCAATRTCPAAGAGGNAGEAGAPEAPTSGGSSGTGGSRGGAAGTSSDGGMAGDGGDRGDGGNAARAGAGGASGNVSGDSGNGGEGGDAVEPTDPCEGVSCGRGVCADVDGEGVCECETGFAGTACELPSFEWIELLDGHDHAEVSVLSENGTVLGWSCQYDNCDATKEWFRWAHDTGSSVFGNSDILTIGDANRDASVVVGQLRGTPNSRAFRWTEASGFVSLGLLLGSDASLGSAAQGVTADGAVVVGASGPDPFRWTSGTGMVRLALPDGSPAGSVGEGLAVSDDGSIVAGNLVFLNVLRWSASGEVEWIEPSINAYATGMSADGEVIVGTGDFAEAREAFRWTRLGGMVSLGRPNQCTGTGARAVSGNGRVIAVGCSSPDGGGWYLWDIDGGFRRLEDVLESTGATFSDASLVEVLRFSFDGSSILGSTTPSGTDVSTPWIARLPAERD